MQVTIDAEDLYALIQAADTEADEQRQCAHELHDAEAMNRTRHLYQAIRAARQAINMATYEEITARRPDVNQEPPHAE